MCEKILELKAGLWTFVDTEGVEPTNNAAERALRPFVLRRKCCYQTRGERGNRFVERSMTVGVTYRSQGRNVLDYLTEAIQAHASQQSGPSLLPYESLEHAAVA